MKKVLILLFSLTVLLNLREVLLQRVFAQTLSPMNITIRAKGTACDGQYPAMTLKIGTAEVMRWPSVPATLSDYTYTSRVSYPGNIYVVFNNDCYKPNIEDRNLFVDYITVNGTKIESESEGVTNTGGTGEWLFGVGYMEFPLVTVSATPTLTPTPNTDGAPASPSAPISLPPDPCQPVNQEIIVACGATNKCNDLQKAIDAVTEPRTWIHIQAGTCTSTAQGDTAFRIVGKPLMWINTVEGDEKHLTKIDVSNYKTGFYIEKSSVFLSGPEIVGSSPNELISVKNADGVEFQNLVLSNETGSAIKISNAFNIAIARSTMKSSGTVVTLDYASNITLFDNHIKGSSKYGIQSNNSYGYISHNLLQANTMAAVMLSANNSMEFDNNTIVENGPSNLLAPIVQDATDLDGKSKLTFRGNNIVDNKSLDANSGGIQFKRIDKVDLTLEHNNVWNNGANSYVGTSDADNSNISVDPLFENRSVFCLKAESPLLKQTGIEYIGYRGTCSTTPLPMPTKPPGISPPIPSQPPTCGCGSDNICDSSCFYKKLACEYTNSCDANYTDSIKCSRESSGIVMSNQDVKNSYCTRYYRTSGDADGNNVIDNLDYFYYVRFVNGGQVPDEINPDFNGDGIVSVSDRKIVIKSLDSQPVPNIPPPGNPTGGRPSIPVSSPPVMTPIPPMTEVPSQLPTMPGGVCPFNHSCTSAMVCTRIGGTLTTQGCVQAGVPGFCCNNAGN